MIKVVLVDDQVIVREGIKCLFQNIPDIQVIADVNHYEDLLRFLRQNSSPKIETHWPDIIIMNIKIPVIDGIKAMADVKAIDPNLKIIVCMSFSESPHPTQLLQAGAVGYVCKQGRFEEIVAGIRKVSLGQRYITPMIAQQIALTSIIDQEDVFSPFDTLSDREIEVMNLLLTGLKIPQISEKLDLSPKTVNSYRYRVFEKLQVNNDVEMTHLAIRHGVIRNELVNYGDRS